jgi:hypothetical protein
MENNTNNNQSNPPKPQKLYIRPWTITLRVKLLSWNARTLDREQG